MIYFLAAITYGMAKKQIAPSILPNVTQNRLYSHAPTVITSPAGSISAAVSKVILATLCSNPVVKKANKHQKTMINLAASFFV